MSERAPRLRPDDLDAAQQELYRAITGGPRARNASVLPVVDADGALEGPFGPMLHAPALGAPLQQLGAAIRSRMTVSDRIRELATLWCGVLARSGYEVDAHRRLAADAGVTADEIEALLAGDLPPSLSTEERSFIQAAARETWTDEEFAAARRLLGERGIAEAITLGGYYRTLAALLNAFGIDRVTG